MRVLVVHPGPNFSVADVHAGLLKGLKQNGCEVANFNLDDRLEFYSRAHVKQDDGSFTKAFQEETAFEMAAKGIEAVCFEWLPDVVIIISGFFIPPKVWDILRRRIPHLVYWCTESPYEDDRQARAARYVDLVILNDPTNLDGFRSQVNPQTHYFPHSYDPDIHKPGPAVPALMSDFTFVGTGFPSRIEWLEAVDWSGIGVLLGGNWKTCTENSPLLPFLVHHRDQCMDNVTTVNVYRSTKTSLNLYRKEHSDAAHADGWAMGPREVELAACGTFFFREPRGEGDEVFPLHPTVDAAEDFGDQLRWWLNHDSKRESVAKRGQTAVAQRTFKNSAARLLRLVESRRASAA